MCIALVMNIMGCIREICWRRSRKYKDERKEKLGKSSGGVQHSLALPSEVIHIPSYRLMLEYSAFQQRGYYPETPDKENQDCFCIRTRIQGNLNVHFFGVFDGHGKYGAQCAKFVSDRLVELLCSDNSFLDDPVRSYNTAFSEVNDDLHRSYIDDSMSGTTAITILVVGDMLYIANVGDSRAVIAVKDGDRVLAENLSEDQTPFRKDECERVKLYGARILSVDQLEGLRDPRIQTWGGDDYDDPPRLWVQEGTYPGTAFTRSIGDSVAEKIGVISAPEVKTVQLTPDHPFFVIASDGVFEFLSSQNVVDMVNGYGDPRDACSAVSGESYKLLLENDSRTDDITIITVQIKDVPGI